ncbi:MAG: hypothetical protein RLY61_328, partial [Candidatus Parcubacteria bacterium]
MPVATIPPQYNASVHFWSPDIQKKAGISTSDFLESSSGVLPLSFLNCPLQQ